MHIGIGCSLDEIDQFKDAFEVINIENPLYPNYLENDYERDIVMVREGLVGKHVVVDGPYIDLNPGTPEQRVRLLTMEKVRESIGYARAIGAKEIIFLSTFLPWINVDFYEQGWITASISFWREVMETVGHIRVSLCNTFEFTPDVLIEVIEGVGHADFGPAFDIGHALAYGKIPLDTWYDRIKDHTLTLYVHSNDKTGDTHQDLSQGLLMKDNGFKKIMGNAHNKNVILKQFDHSNYRANLEIVNKAAGNR